MVAIKRERASSPIVHTIPDVMAMLSCSRSLVYEMITRGDIAAIKIASATRITDASVKKLLATARKGLSDPIIPEEHRHKQKGRRKVARLVKPNATDARRTTMVAIKRERLPNRRQSETLDFELAGHIGEVKR